MGAPRKWARIAAVHSAECTISARTVSGQSVGLSARIDPARKLACEVAALVAFVTVSRRWSRPRSALVVRSCMVSGVSKSLVRDDRFQLRGASPLTIATATTQPGRAIS
jgi:hypothetical protein